MRRRPNPSDSERRHPMGSSGPLPRSTARVLPSALLVLLALVAAACNPEGDLLTGPVDALPRTLSEGEEEVRDASTRFSFDFLREVLEREPPDGNVFVSPLSASYALAMTLNGAEGGTADAMRRTLHLGDMPLGEVNRSYRDLTELLLGLDPGVEMGIANGLWVREDFPLSERVTEDLTADFDAVVEEAAFGPETLERINAFVSERTNGRIDPLLESIARNEVLLLVNALYFQASWTTRFDPDETEPAPFRTPGEGDAEVAMMSREAPFRVARLDDALVLELDYAGEAYAMTVVVPEGERTPEELAARLDERRWTEMLDALSAARDEARIELPRFRVEYSLEADRMEEVLTELGMGVAFDLGRAEFEGFLEQPIPERLYMTRALQKTFVEVDEEGTEAAAATAVGIGVTSGPPTYRVDRPFLFFIRERFSGAVLFAGRIANPAE